MQHTPKIGKPTKVKPQVGWMSLIGTGKERPVSWGNYFALSGHKRVWNMWSENLEAAVEQFNLGNSIDVIEYDQGCIIVDERIPSDWLYNKLCFTGGYKPSVDEAREIYEILGDPNNEFEQFTDPVEYHRKRNASYNPETGIVTYKSIGESRTLTNVKWKVKVETDDGYFFAPYIPVGIDK